MRNHFPDSCVFGLASMQGAETARGPLAGWVTWVGERAQVALLTKFLPSYGALAAGIRAGAIDAAWLPPVVYAVLEKAKVVEALVSNHRAGQAAFHGVLLVRSESTTHTLDGLRGTRVAWVDPCSASGYVMPRIQLAMLGVDPRSAFTHEVFTGSHDASVRALVAGEVDVAATFARVDGAGHVTAGSWSQIEGMRPRVRVLCTFGAIPSDVMVARVGQSSAVLERVTEALVASTNDPKAAPLARRLFGVEEFRRGHVKSYESLGRAIEQASANKLIDALPLASL